MDSESFGDEGVQEIVRRYFIPVRIDPESNAELIYNNTRISERQFAGSLALSRYPGIFFAEQDGRRIYSQQGFMAADELKGILLYIAENHFQKMELDTYMNSRH
jgi:thioredoxin-related protein